MVVSVMLEFTQQRGKRRNDGIHKPLKLAQFLSDSIRHSTVCSGDPSKLTSHDAFRYAAHGFLQGKKSFSVHHYWVSAFRLQRSCWVVSRLAFRHNRLVHRGRSSEGNY